MTGERLLPSSMGPEICPVLFDRMNASVFTDCILVFQSEKLSATELGK